MEKRLKKGFDEKIDDLKEEVKAGFKSTNGRLERIENGQNLLFLQTKNLTDELDVVETVDMPKIRRSVRNLNKRLLKHEGLPSHKPVLKAGR